MSVLFCAFFVSSKVKRLVSEVHLPKFDQWWERSVIYQIWPKSFCDSNGDGIGDIQGIISKLDYLKELGIDIVWLSPLYASPDRDNGYDVSDYYAISPRYGTMEDFDTLLSEVHRRAMRLVMDIVLNHSSRT